MSLGGDYNCRSSEAGVAASNYMFTDQERDISTGLYNYDARLYDPVIGIFLTADIVIQSPYDPQSLNRYSYCRNNPLIYIDPSGHNWLNDIVKGFFKDLDLVLIQLTIWSKEDYRD